MSKVANFDPNYTHGNNQTIQTQPMYVATNTDHFLIQQPTGYNNMPPQPPGIYTVPLGAVQPGIFHISHDLI